MPGKFSSMYFWKHLTPSLFQGVQPLSDHAHGRAENSIMAQTQKFVSPSE